MPSTSAKFEILEPITFPKAKSGEPFKAEFKLTKSSGADVPNATTVKPTTNELTLNRNASLVAPFTSTSPPKISVIIPISE